MTYLLDTNAISDLMRAAPRIENWMAGLVARVPPGRRRAELEETGRQFLAAIRCEPLPERAGDVYAALKLARQQRGLSLDENDLWVAATAVALGATLVSRDSDFRGIDGLAVIALE